jgi:mRNA interferase MazF
MGVGKGDIMLVQFPFTDLSQTKLRPAVVLHSSASKNETTLCFISSQKLDRLTGNEFTLMDVDPEFSRTGLRVSSKVRVTRIVTLNNQLISRKLGQLGPQQIQTLNIKLKQAFAID